MELYARKIYELKIGDMIAHLHNGRLMTSKVFKIFDDVIITEDEIEFYPNMEGHYIIIE